MAKGHLEVLFFVSAKGGEGYDGNIFCIESDFGEDRV